MYQINVSCMEYPSVWRVLITFSVQEGPSRVRALGTRELWLENTDPGGDALMDALSIVKRAMEAELRPNR